MVTVMLNARELTVMFDGMREWLQKAKVGQGRPLDRVEQSREGQTGGGSGEVQNPGGAREVNAKNQPARGRAKSQQNVEGGSSEKLKKFEGRTCREVSEKASSRSK